MHIFLECEESSQNENTPWWLRVLSAYNFPRLMNHASEMLLFYLYTKKQLSQATRDDFAARQSLCCACHDSATWRPACLSGIPPVSHESVSSGAIWGAVAVLNRAFCAHPLFLLVS